MPETDISISKKVSKVRNKKKIVRVIVSLLTGIALLTIFIFFSFHALRLKFGLWTLNNKVDRQELDNGVKPVFEYLLKGYISPFKQNMNTIWESMEIKGMNYFTFGGTKTLFSKYVERSNPYSHLYQSWFGTYIIKCDVHKFFDSNGELIIEELGKLAELDQNAWLKAAGDKATHANWLDFGMQESINVDGQNVKFIQGTLVTHSDLSDNGESKLAGLLGMPSGKLWKNELSAYHDITLKGIYGSY
jgi:hypothetical protein